MSKNSLVTPLAQHTLLKVVGLLFFAVAALHLLRLIYGWHVVIEDFDVPLWFSWVGLLVGAYLSYSSFNLGKR